MENLKDFLKMERLKFVKALKMDIFMERLYTTMKMVKLKFVKNIEIKRKMADI